MAKQPPSKKEAAAPGIQWPVSARQAPSKYSGTDNECGSRIISAFEKNKLNKYSSSILLRNEQTTEETLWCKDWMPAKMPPRQPVCYTGGQDMV